MKSIASILSVILLLGCTNQSSSDIENSLRFEIIEVTAKIIKDSLNRINPMRKDTIYIFDSIKRNKYIDFFKVKELDLFSVKDFAFMENQNLSIFHYDFRRLIKLGLQPSSKIGFNENIPFFQNNSQYVISKPLFSMDYNKALINVDFICYDCGQGYILILNKERNKWKLINIIRTWLN